MPIVLCIVICLFVLLLLLLISKIKLTFEYKKYPGENLYTDYSVYVGFIKLDKFIKKDEKKEDTRAKKSKSSKDNEDSLLKKIKTLIKTFEIVKKVYSKNRWNIQKSLKVDNVNIHIKFGLSDAAKTGIATGALWSLLYGGLSLCDSVGTVENHFFEVAPVFTEEGFISQGNVKLSVRVISAITLLVRLYLTYNKLTKDD